MSATKSGREGCEERKKGRDHVCCVVEVVFKNILIYLRKKDRLFVKMIWDITVDPHQHIFEEILADVSYFFEKFILLLCDKFFFQKFIDIV